MSQNISCNFINKLLKTSISTEINSKPISGPNDLVSEIVNLKFPPKLPNGTNGLVSSTTSAIDVEDKFDMSLSIPPTDKDVWIFGYGSLVWKADFPYIAKQAGYINGYERRFYQHSIDHRGVPSAPGRVVTLIHSTRPQSKVYGVAYRIADSQKLKVLEHLDYREKNGYERCTLAFHTVPESASVYDVIMYIATEENDSFAGGVTNLDDIARQIFKSAGPSGTNREYLYKLAIAMRSHFPGLDDEHLYALEAKVREMETKKLREDVSEILLAVKSEHEFDEEAIRTKLTTLVEKYIHSR